ncbi:hypothetical protein EDD18DRAFT_1153284, partial [Armillaria luteobubalina]
FLFHASHELMTLAVVFSSTAPGSFSADHEYREEGLLQYIHGGTPSHVNVTTECYERLEVALMTRIPVSIRMQVPRCQMRPRSNATAPK